MVKKDELLAALEGQSNQIFQQVGQQIKTLMDQLLPKIDDISKKLQIHIEGQNALKDASKNWNKTPVPQHTPT